MIPTEYFRMECDCSVYEENMLYIDSCYELALAHGFSTDEFIIFKYCPWCGKKLIKVPINKNMSLRQAQRCSYRLHTHMIPDTGMWKYFFDTSQFYQGEGIINGNQDYKEHNTKW